ncbi:YeeE/YedE family protein [Paraburkholderia acidiphila]|uniref:YeeE/YedE family protein n=1 Tax=Paraburkholderia acidiphila TaxID=2571747 RepID=A0A7Z2G2M7_9BURK|nr:YeeE/YedE thiosulfate transporter family protein [Paraburkholderia acidiphila]QGZ53939.1 YeeE/YedE family protein [Paraburkholderia acidiphila]
MSLDLAHFTPFASFAGGLMIGAAAALFVLVNGRIAGISGLLGGLLPGSGAERGVNAAFVAGLVAAPLLWRLRAALPAMQIDASALTLVVAGLLVGVGTRYGSGCTSGHGVCGIARGSRRSFVATGAFMAAGFATVFAVRHLIGG